MELGTMTVNQERDTGLQFQQLQNYAMEVESCNRILKGQYNTLA
jgi:hypothetical protein